MGKIKIKQESLKNFKSSSTPMTTVFTDSVDVKIKVNLNGFKNIVSTIVVVPEPQYLISSGFLKFPDPDPVSTVLK